MLRKMLFIIFSLIFLLDISAQESVAGDELELKNENFIKSIVEADNIFMGFFIQGGKTKARIRVENSFVGDAKEDVVVNNIDNEKLRLKVKRDEFKKGEMYIFITKKDGSEFKLLEDSITIPVANNQANF